MSEHKKNILVVEDNPVAAKMTKKLLELLGCQVGQVSDGDEAVKQVLKTHYDGVCMDIGLPTMSGVEACKAIRKHETKHHLPPTPIVALTVNDSPEEISEYLSVGMQAVINKPFTKEKAEYFLSFCK
jgi:CheY-like chemotaxis protein